MQGKSREKMNTSQPERWLRQTGELRSRHNAKEKAQSDPLEKR